MQRALRCHVRAEWTGFDTVCLEETGLDAWTLFKGYELPLELIAELQGLLSPESAEGEGQPDEAALAEGLAFWRVATQAAPGKDSDNTASRD